MPEIALLLIDIQNDYFPGGKMELEGSEAAVQVAARLLDFFRTQGWPIIHVQHLAVRPGAPFFVPNTPGVEIHSRVQPRAGEIVIQKHFPNSFRETELLRHLQKQKISHLMIAGMMTHMCVEAATRAAVDLGFTCLVAQDACATRSLQFQERVVAAPDVQAAFLAALQGLYARVLPAETIMAELLSGSWGSH